MYKAIRTVLKSMVVFSVMSGTSVAAIISVGGDITIIPTPSSVEPGMLESSTNIFAFDERQAYTLTSDLNVDELTGTSAPGVISSGTVVNSYFLHSDPVGNSEDTSAVTTLTATITFDTQILGLIWTGVACPNCPVTSMFLDASDYLGLSSTAYPTGGLGRGYEADDHYLRNNTRDYVTISADGYSLTTVSSSALPLYSDQLRVLTVAVVPVPATVWLFGSGLMGLLGVARRKVHFRNYRY